MDFLRPASWEEALAAKAEHPTAVPIAGGTDVMAEINFDHRRPEYLLDLTRVGDLYEWETGEQSVRLGASVPYTRIMENLREELPGLALASFLGYRLFRSQPAG
jgi:CO/xanthine dehydrogenase FAD-binding subunit